MYAQLDEDDEVHQVHCFFCYKTNCSQALCRVSDCELSCGARFHICKASEHKLLCPNQKNPCINSMYGCPKIIANSQRGVHLETCPASVIICCMEWNRWPVYTDERKLYSSLSRLPVRVNCAQLDMALAMRDQRMLNKARKVPRRMKRVLRNNLTRRYPAVPIQYREGSDDDESTATSTISDDEDTLWDLAAMPPGLQRSVCSKLYLAQQQEKMNKATVEDVSPFSSLEELNEPVEVISELNGSVTCHYSVHTVDEADDSDQDDDNPDLQNKHDAHVKKIPAASSHTVLCDLLDVDLNLEFISRYQPKPRTMYTFLCAQEFRRDEYPWHYANVHTDIHYGLNGWLEQRCPLAQYGCTFSIRRLCPNDMNYKIVHSKLLESFGIRSLVGDSLKMTKSPSVDSYWTSKKEKERFLSMPNISHSQRDVTPEICTSTVYEGHVQLSDRGRSMSPVAKSSSQELKLTDLPEEILRTIVRYLDGFALNCLSMTCHQLRTVCASVLEQRGIVVCEWQRYHHNDTVHWRQSHKRWIFTRAFSPVRRWRLTDHPSVAEHLKTCPFNQRMEHSKPDLLTVVSWPGAETRHKLLGDRLQMMFSSSGEEGGWL